MWYSNVIFKCDIQMWYSNVIFKCDMWHDSFMSRWWAPQYHPCSSGCNKVPLVDMWHDSFICDMTHSFVCEITQSLHEIARFRLAATCNACYSLNERLSKMLLHWERWETPQCVDSYKWLIHMWLTQWDDTFIRALFVWLWRVHLSTYEWVISLDESHMNHSDESHMNESSHWVSHIWLSPTSHRWISHHTGVSRIWGNDHTVSRLAAMMSRVATISRLLKSKGL